MAQGVELRELAIAEASGVDDPANGFPDWLVMKSADGVPDELLKAADSYDSLANGLVATQDYLDGAPEEVRKAHEQLSQFVADLAEPEPTESVRGKVAGKLRTILHKGKEEVDVDLNDLIPVLAEREEQLIKAVEERLEAHAEEIRKSVSDAPDAEGEVDVEALSARLDESEKALGEIAEALSKSLDRTENIEKFLSGRQSAESEETEPEAAAEPVAKGAGTSALRGAFERAAKGEIVTLGG